MYIRARQFQIGLRKPVGPDTDILFKYFDLVQPGVGETSRYSLL